MDKLEKILHVPMITMTMFFASDTGSFGPSIGTPRWQDFWESENFVEIRTDWERQKYFIVDE